MNAGDSQSRHPGWLIDALVVTVLAAAWIGFAALVTGGKRMVLYDTFRDMAWAENMRAGRIWADPTLPGQPYWYAPGNPLLVAGISSLTRQSVVDLYGFGLFWFNGLIPVLLYLLVRALWDRMTAILALPAVFLGSHWWLTHALAGIPGIQGVALNLVGLWCWHRCVVAGRADARQRRRAVGVWPALTGLVLSLSAWHHPLCGMVLAGTILLHAGIVLALPGIGGQRVPVNDPSRCRLGLPMLVVAAVSAVLTSPLIVHMLALHARNPAAIHYLAPELTEPEFYAHARTPLIVPLVLLGVWFVVRHAPHALSVVTYLLVALLGQLAGYLSHSPGWPVPFLLPHQFQWHGQLAAGICAAAGIGGLARALAARWRGRLRPNLAAGLWSLLLCILAVAPAARRVNLCGKYLLDLDALLAETRELRAWIVGHTSLDATFVCSPDAAYRIVAGLTGRKCVVLPVHHVNPGVDVARRRADVETMLDTADAQALAGLARKYSATHLLLLFDSPDAARSARSRPPAWSGGEPVFTSSDGLAVVYSLCVR